MARLDGSRGQEITQRRMGWSMLRGEVRLADLHRTRGREAVALAVAHGGRFVTFDRRLALAAVRRRGRSTWSSCDAMRTRAVEARRQLARENPGCT